MTRTVRILAALCPLLGGCFGACSPSIPDPEAECQDLPAPSEQGRVVLGTAEDSEFEELSDGTTLKLDYGPQGGHHFYYSVRLYKPTSSMTLVVRFTPDDYEPEGEGGAGGAGGGDGAGGGYYEELTPGGSDFIFLSDYLEESCDDGWVEIKNLFLIVEGGSPSGTFRVELGDCDEDGCPTDADGNYAHDTVVDDASVALTYTD